MSPIRGNDRPYRPPRRIAIGAPRAATPGSVLACLLLASGIDEWVGVDLTSGALVRNPATAEGIPRIEGGSPFAIATFTLAPSPGPIDPGRPEAIWPAEPPVIGGRIRRRALRRLLRQLAAPELDGTPILASRGPSLAYIDLDGGSPSVVLVATSPKHLELLVRKDGQCCCSLEWGGVTQVLPLIDGPVCEVAHQAAPRSLTGASLVTALGFRPGYLLCGLGRVHEGHVPKLVLGILPARP